MALGSKFTLVVTCLTLVPALCRAQNDCFTSGSIVSAVLATFFSTAIALALLVFLLWWIYYRRSPYAAGGHDGEKKGSRQVESGSGFDNPCFEANPNSDVVDGGKASDYDGRKDVKSTSWTPLRFFGVGKNDKKRSMDDSFVSEPERVSVQLRGHDFTGLGFNVTGNMRDGIFIKDILNRGPAFESGKIAPGDRILNVTISFRHVVYEDALTILSYASPYDVTMELEKGLRLSSSTLKKRKATSAVCLAGSPSATLSVSATAGSAQSPEAPSNERLVHPLYRSQSIDDLSKVGRAGDALVRADMRLPNVTAQLSKSKLVGKANLDVNLADVKMKKPSLNVDATEVNVAPVDVSLDMPSGKSVKASKFGIKVLPDFKFKSSVKHPDLDMTPLPVGLDVPEVEVHVPSGAQQVALDIDVPDGSSLPSRDLSVAIEMPEQELARFAASGGDVKLDMEPPSIELPSVAVGSDLKFKGPQMNQPSLPQGGVDLKSPTLPDLTIEHEEVSLDATKAAKSGGFHIKFPKFGGGSSKAAKAELPDVNIAAPEVDVSLPDTSIEIDPTLKKDAKAGFKMPKLSLKKKAEINVDAKAQLPEVDVDVKVPETKVQVPVLSASSPDVDIPSVTVEVKKPKMGFSMPKFNMGKGESKDSASLAVDAPSAQIDLPNVTLTSDEEDEGGKKKSMKFGKMPKFGMGAKAQIDADVPDVPDVDIDKPEAKGKSSKFGFKLPKMGASVSGPDVDIDASADVKLPKLEKPSESDSSSSSEDEADDADKKTKKKMGIKMPKFGSAKVDADLPSVTEAINVDMPQMQTPNIDAKVDIGVPNLSADVLRMPSDSEDSDSGDDDDDKKKSKSLKMKLPRVNLGGDASIPNLSPITVESPSIDIQAPSIDASLDLKRPSIEKPNLPSADLELDVKAPVLPDIAVSQDIPNPEVSIDVTKAAKSGGFHIKFPKFGGGSKSVKADLPEANVNIAAPELDVSLPEASVEIDPKLKKEAHKSGFKMPKLSLKKKADINIDAKAQLPEVDVDVKVPDASLEPVDVELPSAAVEVKKPKMSFSMPKFHMGKSHGDAKESVAVDLPNVQVDVAHPTLLSDDDDDHAGGKKKSKFGKMPKFGLNKSVNLSDSSVEVDVPSVDIGDVEKPEIKSKNKFGFKLPKMGGSASASDVDIDADVKLPKVDIKTQQSDSSSSDDEDDATPADGAKKKKKFSIKMPKFGSPKVDVDLPKVDANLPKVEVNQPQAQINVPDVSIDVPTVEIGDVEKPESKGKSKFGFKLPKMGASANAPDVSLDVDADVKLPKIEKKTESDSSSSSEDEADDGAKKKKKFNIKMPKFGSAKVDADLPSAGSVSVDAPTVPEIDASANLDLPKLDVSLAKLSSDDSDSDDDAKGRPSSLDIDVGKADLDVSLDGSLGAKKKSSKFGMKLPRLQMEKTRDKGDGQSDSESSSDDEDGKKSGRVTVPSLHLAKTDMEVQGNVDLPNLVELEKPKMDVTVEAETTDDDTKKKSNKFAFSIKMPKFHMKKQTPHVDVDLDKEASAQLNLDVTSGETDDDRSSEDNPDKKRGAGKMSVKMPKFGVKKPDVDTDFNIKVAKPEIDLPSIDVDVDTSIKATPLTIDKPQVELNVDAAEPVSMPDAALRLDAPSLKMEMPSVDLEVEHDDGDDDKKKSGSKFFKMPKFHMGKHHGEVKVDAPKVKVPDVDLPSAKLELDVPSVDLHAKDDSDSDDDDDKKESGKKKPRFGIKLPKFQMKHSHGDVAKPEDVTGKIPSLPEANVEASIDAQVPSIDINSPKLSADVTSPSADLELAAPELKMDLGDKDSGKKKGKFSFKSNFKMPKIHMGKGGGGQAELEVPAAEISLPKVEVDSSSDSDDGDDGNKKKSKFGVGLSMPKVAKPSGDVDIEADLTGPSLTGPSLTGPSLPSPSLKLKTDKDSDTSHSEDDDDDTGEKKKSGFGFKMPKLNIGGGGGQVDVDLPEIKPEVKLPEVDPKIETDFEIQSGELSKKTSPFIVKMPALTPIQADIDLEPKVRGDSVSSSSESSDESDGEGKTKKKGFKLGFKMPNLSLGGKGDVDLDSSQVEQPQLELPSVEADVSLPEGSPSKKKSGSFGAQFKMPTFSGKSNVQVASVDVETPQIEVDDEELKTQKLSVKLPKFQTRQRDADIVLPQVELKAEESSSSSSSDDEHDDKEVKVKKPKFGIKLPELTKPKVDVVRKDVDLDVQPLSLSADVPKFDADANVDVQVGNIDAEVAKVKAQLAQLQAEFDSQSSTAAAKIEAKKQDDDESSSSSSDSESESKSKSKFGLKMPKFSLGKDKVEVEPKIEAKIDVAPPSLTTKSNNGDDLTSPSMSSLEVEPVKLETIEKEKKKFSLGLKMPKFQTKGHGEGEASKDVDLSLESKPVKIKGSKMKFKKKKADRPSSSSDSDSDDNKAEQEHKTKEASALASSSSSGSISNSQVMEVKLPRVQVYKNVEYHEAEKAHHDSSSDEEDEVKDIKKNIGARFGVKLKKPKMFSSSKIEITGKNDSGSSSLQPEWKLPRVDLRRTSKNLDQELSVDVDMDVDQQKLEQLSPSERAEAIRRDAKSSAGIRLHSPSYLSPRSKKQSLEMLDVESSPKLLSVTRLETPPIESSSQPPLYGKMEVTVSGPQVLASQVPSSVIMASDAVKMKRGPPIPARRSIVDPNASVFYVAQPADVTVENVSVVGVGLDASMETNEPLTTTSILTNPQASDTDISISTSTGSDTLVISCGGPSSPSGQQEAHNRKASSLGDLTRIPTSGSEDGSLERTVSLDFKPVTTSTGGSSSRAIYNLAVQDLSRVGEDSDEDYNLNRKRPATTTADNVNVEGEVTIVTATETGYLANNRTLLTINTGTDESDGGSLANPIQSTTGDIGEALWFGSTSIQTVESVQTTMSYSQMEESISTDVTLTTTSLGTSPSETSSSSSDDSPFSPASPERSGQSTPNLIEQDPQMDLENGNNRSQIYRGDITSEGEINTTRTITLDMSSLPDDSQPQPLTDLNPSAGNFAAVRNRFEQLSGSNPSLNGAENPSGSPGSRHSGRLSQGSVIKRLSGNFEDSPPVIQKSIMQHIGPELSEGAISRTVIISSLTLERTEQSEVSATTVIGPESPVPNLEPPC